MSYVIRHILLQISPKSWDVGFLRHTGRRLTALLSGLALVLSITLTPALAGGIIRDAETESLLKIYTKPIFEAAQLGTGRVDVIIINEKSINAFVANGQKIYIHTGIIIEAEHPGQVIGVLAHETGHITGGHLASFREQLEKSELAGIMGFLLGLGIMAAGAATGIDGASEVGSAVAATGQNIGIGSFLSYRREQESSADLAAARFLEIAGISGRGMLEFFEKLADQQLATLRNINPYLLTHPLPRNRIGILKKNVESSPYYDTPSDSDLLHRHQMVRAKLIAFLGKPKSTFRQYPETDQSYPARYARAIAHYRLAEIDKAVASIDQLLQDLPDNPYLFELRGQVLFESGRIEESLPSLRKAVNLAPDEPLIRLLYAQALIEHNTPESDKIALKNLRQVALKEPRSSQVHYRLAILYARNGNLALANLESAEAAYYKGDHDTAFALAKRAQSEFKESSPSWIRAEDIISQVQRIRKKRS